jgi:hypothetical protein
MVLLIPATVLVLVVFAAFTPRPALRHAARASAILLASALPSLYVTLYVATALRWLGEAAGIEFSGRGGPLPDWCYAVTFLSMVLGSLSLYARHVVRARQRDAGG